MEVDEENLDKKNNREVKPKFVARTLSEMQRVKLDKLMKNPAKNVIPESIVAEKDFMNTIPSFVRNVMGSSAGAGSGEFHVYRHLRRKEYARQKFIQHANLKEKLDGEFYDKIEQNKLLADSKTAKKRLKRQKMKAKLKGKPKKTKSDVVEKPESSSSSSSESDEKEDSDSKEENKDIENNDEKVSEDNQKELNVESEAPDNKTEVLEVENNNEKGVLQTVEQKPIESSSLDVTVNEDKPTDVLDESKDKEEADVVSSVEVDEQ